MERMFSALMGLIKKPLRHDRGIKTDSSILLIYPPERELDFREYLLDTFVPELDAKGIPYRLLDLTGFLFAGLSEEQVEALQDSEFDDYRWMQQGLSKRTETALQARLTDEAMKISGGNVIVYATVALYPLVRYGEVLRELRDLKARVILAFPGAERGGKLHFMNQADGANYLAVKLFAREGTG
ncbi:BREX protein BrxB domain-containing protein [Variovorax sp. LjRoot178]|uniref:BREX protein BrxB domain-containing protein n=1 Tax=Variovorax sp. LjRoot178 TaxID=3342277 RepID=UPI003ECC28D4